MTTNVPKGAGRATATAKRNKHAQRTPLPPKAGSAGAKAIAAAKCPGGEEAHYSHLDANDECPWCDMDPETGEVAEVAASNLIHAEVIELKGKPYGEMTVAELRKVAQSLMVSGYKAMRRADLLNAILEAEKAVSANAKRFEGRDLAAEVFQVAEKSKPATPARQPEAKVIESDCSGDPNVPVTEGQAKSLAKAEAFLLAAAALGWAEYARSAPDQETYGVIVGREEERIAISWLNGVFIGEECYHSHPARTPRKVINASAAKKIMAIPPAQADEEARKVSAHKASRPRREKGAAATTAGRKALPFDPETATDEEVLGAVTGKRLTWTNEVSGTIEDAYVTGTPSIQPGKSGRSIRFTSMTGFRSVRVSSIIAIR